MSIGATLAQARDQAGLTRAEVSARTRIRESLILDIEHDQFASCGGDVYARGHIRAIAAVVGADQAALIEEYDAEHHYGNRAALDDLLSQPPPAPEPARVPRPAPEPAPRPAPGPVPPGRRRRGWLVPVAMLCCLVGVVFIAYQLTGTGGARRPDAAASHTRPATSATPSRGPQAGPSQASAPAAPPPSPAAVQVRQLTPVSAAAFGPGGTSDGDNPQHASNALSGNPAEPWHTDWYTTARFGNLKDGTGLLLDLGRTVTATNVTVQLGNANGADLRISAGTSPADMHVVASAANAGGTVQMRLSSHPDARYVLVWFTLLPPDSAGTYQATISRVTVTAASPR